MIVSVCEPRSTTAVLELPKRPATDAPAVVCEMSSVPPLRKLTKLELAIEPVPDSARVAPKSICVALV